MTDQRAVFRPSAGKTRPTAGRTCPLKRQVPQRRIDALELVLPGRQVEPHDEYHDPVDPLAAGLLRRLPVGTRARTFAPSLVLQR